MLHRSITIAAALAAALIMASSPGEGRAETPRSELPNGAKLTRVRLGTGIDLQVAQSGPANGEPVLFLHGFTDSWYSYTRVLPQLPANIRAIVPTQRGHGESDKPTCCYRVDDFAADAVALLDALGIERAHIVGHSMGSIIAQRVASKWPARVNRLVLVASSTTARTPPALEFMSAVRKLTDPLPAGFAREFQISTVFKPLPAAFLDTVVLESEKLPARIWRDALGGLVAPDAVSDHRHIAAPTLIVWGDKDAIFARAYQDALARAIKGARLLVYANIGHSPFWEDPDRFTKDLMKFLNERADAARPADTRHHESHKAPATSDSASLIAGLGTWHRAISTTSKDAQRLFDQGLRLTYAFNHDEAVRSFERAAQLDSTCAMCYWGLAYALGPNINLPMDTKVEPLALQAVRQAQRMATRATPAERSLIDAMALRYGGGQSQEPDPTSRAARDSAYATAMRTVARRFPADADAQVLFADAMLNLRPWNQWTREGRAQPGTAELVSALERVLVRVPTHAGACHLYVHAVEASQTPERALPCAERLPRLMPGAGHVVHMPAHVYLRVGRYEDAARANIAAVQADHRYFTAHESKPGFYPAFLAPHNLHFLWATYLLSGQRGKALDVSRALAARVALDDARANAALEAFLSTPVLTLARFRDWAGILREPAPAEDLRYLRGIWHYARGLAFAERGDAELANAELGSVRQIAADVKDDVIIILNPAPTLLKLAGEVLSGEIARQQKRFDESIAHFRASLAIEDALTYDEPPPWYQSTRGFLANALLEQGRAAEAEAVFRDDLRVTRETGWSLSGLERALRAQGKNNEALAVARRFKAAWQYADSPAY